MAFDPTYFWDGRISRYWAGKDGDGRHEWTAMVHSAATAPAGVGMPVGPEVDRYSFSIRREFTNDAWRGAVTGEAMPDWHHVAYVTSPSAAPEIYVDGTLATHSTSGPNGDRVGNLPGPFTIGGVIDEPSNSGWWGRICCVSFTPSVLSGSRIAAHHAAMSTGVDDYVNEVLADSPAGMWPMQEASGLIQDVSGNDRHATSAVGSPDHRREGPAPGAYAVYFDARTNDRFHIPDNAVWSAGSFTIEAWLRPREQPPRRGMRGLGILVR